MKLIKACIALAAFAAIFVVPPIASASNDPAVYEPTNTLLAPSHASPVGIIATNEGVTVMTNNNTEPLVECQTATMTGHLETNTPTPTAEAKIEGTITTAEFKNHASTHCSGPLGPTLVTTSPVASTGLPWCLSSTAGMKTNEFQVRGNNCTGASRAITFTLHVTALGLACNYERKAAISGTYTTHPAAAQATIDHVEFVRHNSSIFCPEKGLLDMKFNLYRDVVGEDTKFPLYIKNHDNK